MIGADNEILFYLYALAGVVVALCALGVMSLVSALLLRLAATWLGLGMPSYAIAFRAALTANFTMFALNYSAAGSALFLNLARGSRLYEREPAYMFTPTYLTLTSIFSLAVTAAIFYRMVPNLPSAGRLTLGDAAALSSLYTALSILCFVVLSLLIAIGVATYIWTAAMNGSGPF